MVQAHIYCFSLPQHLLLKTSPHYPSIRKLVMTQWLQVAIAKHNEPNGTSINKNFSVTVSLHHYLTIK